MVKVGIVGGAGYVAGELLRLLLAHPEVDVEFVRSESHAGHPLHEAHPDLLGETSLRFTEGYPSDAEIDLLFLCSGHGASHAFLDHHDVPASVKVIDMSADFRMRKDAEYKGREFIYGLPELHRSSICTASSIANPGCFATLIQLALLPLAQEGVLRESVHTTAITGSTGAGAALGPTTHFTWRMDNVSVYKPFTHQHLGEIRQGLNSLQSGWHRPLHFIPMRGNFTRGIFGTIYTECSLTEKEVAELYNDFYADHPFTLIAESAPDLKQVVNTNKAVLHPAKHDDLLLVTGVLDNMLKGASGQGVQNMNLLFGFDESTGLRLKGTAF